MPIYNNIKDLQRLDPDRVYADCEVEIDINGEGAWTKICSYGPSIKYFWIALLG